MTNSKKIIIAIVVVALIGIFIAVAITSAKKEESKTGIPKNAIPVELEDAKTETIISTVSAKGTVSLKESHIIYPNNTAKIKKVNVKIGDIITKGQVLIEYDEDSLESLQDQLAQAKLSYEAAKLRLESAKLPATATEKMQAETSVNQAEKSVTDVNSQIEQLDITIEQMNRNIETAEKNYNNLKSLYASGAASKNDLDAAYENVTKLKEQLQTTQTQRQSALLALKNVESSLDLALAQQETVLSKTSEVSVQNLISQQQIAVNQAKLQIEQIEKQITDFSLQEISDVSGTVVSLLANEAEYTNVAKPVMEISDVSSKNLLIKANVPEGDASDIALNQEVEISGSAIGKEKYAGKVTKIYPIAEQKQVGNSMETVITVEISLVDENAKLRSGNTVETLITTKTTENATVVPLMATFSEPGGDNFVYIMKADYTLEKRKIELLAYSGMYVEVTGVEVGEKVVSNPTPQLKEGIYVKPITQQNK